MYWTSELAILCGIISSAVVLAGPTKPIDDCKDVKKEIQSLQEPKIRKPATAYCSQYLGLEQVTETFDVYEYSTDFNLPPETYYPFTVVTAPPGTITETDTYTETIITETLWLTQYYYCTIDPCPTDWDKSTLLITANEPTPTTIRTTITQSPNPLPKADPTKLAKACECLSIPPVTVTRTDIYTFIWAPYTVTGPVDTYTDYNQVVLEIETTTIKSGISTVTIPEVTYPHFEYTTVFYPWPYVFETSTVYLPSQTPRPRPKKTPAHPTKTKWRTSHMHPPKATKPPRKGGKKKGGKI